MMNLGFICYIFEIRLFHIETFINSLISCALQTCFELLQEPMRFILVLQEVKTI